MTGHGAAEDPNDTNVVQKNWQFYHGHDNVPGPTGSITVSSTGSSAFSNTYNNPYNYISGAGTGYSFIGDSTVDNNIRCRCDNTGFNFTDHLVKSDNVGYAKDVGRKFDQNKLEYGLVPPIGFKAVVEILTIGAQKYERDNWKNVPDGKRRYFDAAMRHLWDWKSGDKYDEETSKNHLAHAICNLMFLLEKDLLTE